MASSWRACAMLVALLVISSQPSLIGDQNAYGSASECGPIDEWAEWSHLHLMLGCFDTLQEQHAALRCIGGCLCVSEFGSVIERTTIWHGLGAHADYVASVAHVDWLFSCEVDCEFLVETCCPALQLDEGGSAAGLLALKFIHRQKLCLDSVDGLGDSGLNMTFHGTLPFANDGDIGEEDHWGSDIEGVLCAPDPSMLESMHILALKGRKRKHEAIVSDYNPLTTHDCLFMCLTREIWRIKGERLSPHTLRALACGMWETGQCVLGMNAAQWASMRGQSHEQFINTTLEGRYGIAPDAIMIARLFECSLVIMDGSGRLLTQTGSSSDCIWLRLHDMHYTIPRASARGKLSPNRDDAYYYRSRGRHALVKWVGSPSRFCSVGCRSVCPEKNQKTGACARAPRSKKSRAKTIDLLSHPVGDRWAPGEELEETTVHHEQESIDHPPRSCDLLIQGQVTTEVAVSSVPTMPAVSQLQFEGGVYTPAWPQWQAPRGVDTRLIQLVAPGSTVRSIHVPRSESNGEIELRILEHMAAHKSWYEFKWDGDYVTLTPTCLLPTNVRKNLALLFAAVRELPFRLSRRTTVPDVRSFTAGHRSTRKRGVLKIPVGKLGTILKVNRILRQLVPSIAFSAWSAAHFRNVPVHRDSANNPDKAMVVLSVSKASIWAECSTGTAACEIDRFHVNGSWHEMQQAVLVLPGSCRHQVAARRGSVAIVLYSTTRPIWNVHLSRLRALGFPLSVFDGVQSPCECGDGESQDEDESLVVHAGGVSVDSCWRWRPTLPTIPERAKQDILDEGVVHMFEAAWYFGLQEAPARANVVEADASTLCESTCCIGLKDFIMRMEYAERVKEWQRMARTKRAKIVHRTENDDEGFSVRAADTHEGGGGDASIKNRLVKKMSQAGVTNAQGIVETAWEQHSATMRGIYGSPQQVAERIRGLTGVEPEGAGAKAAAPSPGMVDTLQEKDPWAKFKSKEETKRQGDKDLGSEPLRFQNLRMLTKVFTSEGAELTQRPLEDLLREDHEGVALVHQSMLSEAMSKLETHQGPCVLVTQKGCGAAWKQATIIGAQILVSNHQSLKKAVSVDLVALGNIAVEIRQPAIPVAIPTAAYFEAVVEAHEDQMDKELFGLLARRADLSQVLGRDCQGFAQQQHKLFGAPPSRTVKRVGHVASQDALQFLGLSGMKTLNIRLQQRSDEQALSLMIVAAETADRCKLEECLKGTDHAGYLRTREGKLLVRCTETHVGSVRQRVAPGDIRFRHDPTIVVRYRYKVTNVPVSISAQRLSDALMNGHAWPQIPLRTQHPPKKGPAWVVHLGSAVKPPFDTAVIDNHLCVIAEQNPSQVSPAIVDKSWVAACASNGTVGVTPLSSTQTIQQGLESASKSLSVDVAKKLGELDQRVEAIIQVKMEKAHAETMGRVQALEVQVQSNAQQTATQLQQLAGSVEQRTQKLEGDVGTIVQSLTSMASENRQQFASINAAFDSKLNAFSELMLAQLSKDKKREREEGDADMAHTGAGCNMCNLLVHSMARCEDVGRHWEGKLSSGEDCCSVSCGCVCFVDPRATWSEKKQTREELSCRVLGGQAPGRRIEKMCQESTDHHVCAVSCTVLLFVEISACAGSAGWCDLQLLEHSESSGLDGNLSVIVEISACAGSAGWRDAIRVRQTHGRPSGAMLDGKLDAASRGAGRRVSACVSDWQAEAPETSDLEWPCECMPPMDHHCLSSC
eukprot:2127469-Amphidinium_carterae.1